SGPPFFRSPFDRPAEETKSLGLETTTYTVSESKGDLVAINKSYKLTSPAVTKDDETHEINGSGTWTFNRTAALPESLDFKQDLVVKMAAVSVTFPMIIKSRRLSEEELQKIQEEAQKRLQEAQRLAAENKAKAEAPLEPDAKRQLLGDLASGDTTRVLKAL